MTLDGTIFEKKTLLGIVQETAPQDSFIYPQVAPLTDTASKTALIDILNVQAAGIANYRHPDAEAEIAGRGGADQTLIELADFAVKERFNHEDLRAMREAGQLPVVDNAPSQISLQGAAAERRVREAMERNRARIDARLEWQALQALQGSVTYSSSGINFDIDFGVPANQVAQTPSTLWDNAAATPLDDLITYSDRVYAASGVYPTRLVVSRKILTNLAKNTAWINTYANVGKFVTGYLRAQEIIAQELQLEVIVYDAVYRTRSQALDGTVTTTTNRFLAENRMLLLPPSELDGRNLCETLTAPHYHNDWRPGIYAWSDEITKDPVGVEAGVGITSIPCLYFPDAVLSADVLTA